VTKPEGGRKKREGRGKREGQSRFSFYRQPFLVAIFSRPLRARTEKKGRERAKKEEKEGKKKTTVFHTRLEVARGEIGPAFFPLDASPTGEEKRKKGGKGGDLIASERFLDYAGIPPGVARTTAERKEGKNENRFAKKC